MTNRQSPPRRQACEEARRAAKDILLTAWLASRGMTMSDIEAMVEFEVAEHERQMALPGGRRVDLDEIPF